MFQWRWTEQAATARQTLEKAKRGKYVGLSILQRNHEHDRCDRMPHLTISRRIARNHVGRFSSIVATDSGPFAGDGFRTFRTPSRSRMTSRTMRTASPPIRGRNPESGNRDVQANDVGQLNQVARLNTRVWIAPAPTKITASPKTKRS